MWEISQCFLGKWLWEEASSKVHLARLGKKPNVPPFVYTEPTSSMSLNKQLVKLDQWKLVRWWTGVHTSVNILTAPGTVSTTTATAKAGARRGARAAALLTEKSIFNLNQQSHLVTSAPRATGVPKATVRKWFILTGLLKGPTELDAKTYSSGCIQNATQEMFAEEVNVKRVNMTDTWSLRAEV